MLEQKTEQGIFIHSQRGTVRMRRNEGDVPRGRFAVHPVAQLGAVPVNQPVFRMFVKEARHLPPVRGQTGQGDGRQPVNPAAQFPDFLFINAGGLPVNQEIELEPATVDMAVIIHDHRFRASAVHDGEYH